MQDYNLYNIRPAGILTTSYVAGNILGPNLGNPKDRNQLQILVDFTKGSADSAEIMVEFSHDATTWYQEAFEDINAGVALMSPGLYQLASTMKTMISIPIKAANIRISAKATGTPTGSSLKIDAVLGVV